MSEDRKEYFEIAWGSLRAMVEPSFAERIVINHRDYFTKGDLVTSTAASFTESEVVTEDGRRIQYDYLVIATGHSQPFATTRAQRLFHYKAGNLALGSFVRR